MISSRLLGNRKHGSRLKERPSAAAVTSQDIKWSKLVHDMPYYLYLYALDFLLPWWTHLYFDVVGHPGGIWWYKTDIYMKLDHRVMLSDIDKWKAKARSQDLLYIHRCTKIYTSVIINAAIRQSYVSQL
jgi:hypothetical protein